jgi:hypothetical protein
LQALGEKKSFHSNGIYFESTDILQRKSLTVLASKANNNPRAHLFIVLLFYLIYLMVSHKVINHLRYKYDPFNIP